MILGAFRVHKAADSRSAFLMRAALREPTGTDSSKWDPGRSGDQRIAPEHESESEMVKAAGVQLLKFRLSRLLSVVPVVGSGVVAHQSRQIPHWDGAFGQLHQTGTQPCHGPR
jgi:hypothetical protein